MDSPSESPNALYWFWSEAFGSDELTAYTAEYTWNSNQMAHAMMGFALAVVWLRLAISRWMRHQARLKENPESDPANASGWIRRNFLKAWHSIDVSTLFLFAIIPLKELTDILFDRSSFAKSPVVPNRWPLYFDSITDISFWWSGKFLAAIIVGGWWTLMTQSTASKNSTENGGNGATGEAISISRCEKIIRTIIPIFGLIACVVFWYWYAAPQWLNQKRTFDQSGMPFNYTRLAKLAGQKKDDSFFTEVSPCKWAQLDSFRKEVSGDERPPQRHYVIIGGTPQDRSRLAVSMGCEYAFKLRPDLQTRTPADLTFVKYVSAPAALERPESLTDAMLKSVIECVVIDELDSVIHLPEDTTPAAAAKVLERAPPNLKLSTKTAQRLKLPENFQDLTKEHKQGMQPPPVMGNYSPERFGAEARRIKFELLGNIVRENNISTIWVITGDRTLPAWPANRERWLTEITRLVANGDKNDIQVIELADPK